MRLSVDRIEVNFTLPSDFQYYFYCTELKYVAEVAFLKSRKIISPSIFLLVNPDNGLSLSLLRQPVNYKSEKSHVSSIGSPRLLFLFLN